MVKNEYHYFICRVSAFSYSNYSHTNHSIQAVIIETPSSSAAEKVRKNQHHTTKSMRGGMMRFLIAVVLVLNCGLCCGEDIPDGNIKGRVVSNEQALTAEQAAELVADFEGDLRLRALTSIDIDVAQELAKAKGDLRLKGLKSIDKDVARELAKFIGNLYLNGLTSIDKRVAKELAKFKGHLELGGLTSIDIGVAQEFAKAQGNLYLKGLTSIDKDLARELAKYEGALLYLHGRTSIDELGLTYLKSNPNIHLPEKYRD